MRQYFATIVEKTSNSLVLKPDFVIPGYAIYTVSENGIRVSPPDSQNMMSEELTVMIWKEEFMKKVFALYNVGDKIGVEYKSINN